MIIKKGILSSILAAALLAASFAGCGKSAGDSARQESGAVDAQKIVFWHSMSDNAGIAMDQYVSEFNEGPGRELGIEVEAVFQGTYVDSATKMRAILQNGQYEQLPDIMQIDSTGIMDYKASEYAWTVDEAIAADPDYDISSMLEAPLAVWNYEGRQLGLPLSSSTTVMYYNKTLLDEAGITEPPTTFDGIIEVAEKLPEKNSAGANLTAYAQIPNSPYLTNWIGQMQTKELDSSYVVDNRNGRDATATRLVCDEEGTLRLFLEGWVKMYDAGALANISDGLADSFYAGQTVFYTASTSQLKSIIETVEGSFEVGCAYFPRVSENSLFGATISGSGVFMFNKRDDSKAMAAWEFMKYLTSADIQARLGVATGYFPSHRDAYKTEVYLEAAELYPQMLVGVAQVEQTSPNMINITVGQAREFYMAIQDGVSEMLTTGRSVEDTVASMSATLNGILEQYAKANG